MCIVTPSENSYISMVIILFIFLTLKYNRYMHLVIVVRVHKLLKRKYHVLQVFIILNITFMKIITLKYGSRTSIYFDSVFQMCYKLVEGGFVYGIMILTMTSLIKYNASILKDLPY